MCLFKTKCSHQVYYGSKESAAAGAVGSAYEIREWLSSLLNDLASVFRQELLENMKAQENKQKEQRQQHGSWATAESIAEDLILTYPQWFGVVFLK